MEEIYQLLQIGDQQKAAELLVDFLYQKFGLQARNLNFLQSAVSLNSFKGSFKVGQKRYFFKTHIEVGGEVAEYAGAKLLEKVGYPIIAPIFMCTERGRELLIYPWIEEPSLFEVVYEQGGQFDFVAQEALDKRLFEIYRKTFERGRYEYPAVQQLFYKRLCGSRFKNFYGDSDEFKEFAMMRWIVNGKDLGVLGDKLDIARQLLSPNAQQKFSIIGHGDAHNGNVFLGDNLRYFDPAYAGRMDPFLDLAKPIFHNTFARWMYFPEQVEAELDISIRFENGCVKVDYKCPFFALEQQFLQSKIENVGRPLIEFLRREELLPTDWEDRFRSSLLCCPLLTVNLFKYPKKVTLLGFARVMEMANFNLL